MKKLSLLSLLVVLFISCVGDIGPQGPPGFDGFDGQDGQDGADGLIGSIFDITGTFTEADGYEFFEDLPTNVEDTDVVYAYILTEVDNGINIWEPLPQTLFFDEGILLYGFNHTFFDIKFFLDGTVDFATLDPLFTDEIVFRVAIIPADFAGNIDTSNINEVMKALNIESVKKINL